MKGNNTKPPSGTRDFLPQDVKSRDRVFSTIKEVFENYGFLPMDTPSFERIETLNEKYGEDGDKLMFKILRRGEQALSGETDLALRYDLTIPFVRFVAEYQDKLPKIFRRYQIGPVWRADRPGKARFREFYQCDIDVVDSASPLADAEVILALTEALSRLNLKEFTVQLNSRKVLGGLLEIYDVPTALRKGVLVTIDKLDKIGVKGVKNELLERSVPEKIVEQIVKGIESPVSDIIKRVEKSETGRIGLSEMWNVLNLVDPLLKIGKIEFSPFLVRGLDYYTGPIFEIFVPGAQSAIAGGGRYDNLIGSFTGKQIPACGGSLGVERILALLSNEEPLTISTQVFVTVWDKSFEGDALEIASELRSKDISTEVYVGGSKKLSNQLRLASERSALYCIIYGPDEKGKKEVGIKNLATSEQTRLPKDQLLSTLLGLLGK